MSKVAVIGSGYVGLVTAACLAGFGIEVICVDNDVRKIENLKRGTISIFEPGLKELIDTNIEKNRLSYTCNIKEAIENSDVIFIAVGTPPLDDGSADLQYVLQVANDIGRYMNEYKVIVDKSTVPVGTGQKVKKIITDTLEKRKINISFDIVSNPEFLREGSAIYDFTHTDRVIIGSENEKATNIMKNVYRVLYLNETPFLVTTIETAELIKYASNAFLATKISFINEISELCEKVGANIKQVATGMGMDARIGTKFLHAGPGYGGSCFPKDTRALASIGKNYNCNLEIVNAVISVNEHQKLRMVDKIISEMGDIRDKIITILGLAYKNNTNDMRESPSLTIMNELAKKGARFKVYDPKAMDESKWRQENLKEVIEYCADEYDASKNSDAIIIVTEWNQFRSLDLKKIKNNMSDNFFFDLRNIYNEERMQEIGFNYFGVGM